MRALPSIAFNDFSGTAGDVTARFVNGHTVLTVRPFPNKVYSASQKEHRNSLSKVSRAYKKLSESQMKAWVELAEHLKGISTFGKAAEMTAHNAFVRINCNRDMAGEPMLVNAPCRFTVKPVMDLCLECSIWAMFFSSSLMVSIKALLRRRTLSDMVMI